MAAINAKLKRKQNTVTNKKIKAKVTLLTAKFLWTI